MNEVVVYICTGLSIQNRHLSCIFGKKIHTLNFCYFPLPISMFLKMRGIPLLGAKERRNLGL
jgi:hypothetical protein